jgi:YesN/AraC family two-component response regulator
MDQNVFAVIADYRMPVMDGLVLLRQVRDLVPTALRIILSGFAARPLLQRAVRTNQIHHYITKPWRNEALRVIVRKGVPTASPSAE